MDQSYQQGKWKRQRRRLSNCQAITEQRGREREHQDGAASGFSTSQPLGDLASQGATNPGSIQASSFVELFHACGPGAPLTSSLRKSPGEFREPATETR